MKNDITYKDFPALATYIDRIGAEQKNFRRYMIVEYKARGYYYEKCLIKLLPGGEITVTDKLYAPTKAEATAILAEMSEAESKFPKSILATEAKFAELKKERGKGALLYVFYSRAKHANERDGNIIMVQQRVQKADGDKYFINWSFWSDGKWRAMEPDGALPFWKPKREAGKERGGDLIMIHEGPKTAKMLTELKAKPAEMAKHPFGEVLARYEHWGAIGGALAPHRSDWDDLVAEKPAEVVYVCDNDPPGKNALQKVSASYKRALLGVMFDERFPIAWDLGDEIPPKMFSASGRYIGPAWEELLTFATHATDLKPNPEGGAGRPITVLTEAFSNEWFHCVTPEVFVHKRWPSMVLSANEFNNHVAPFSHVDDTARLVKKTKANKSAILSYQPAQKSGIYANIDGTFINTHIPTLIKDDKPGDVKPFLDFLAHLVPDETDRTELLRWVATLVARPDIKMLYGVLLISEAQGIGKGTLGERILAPLVGTSNVSYPTESEIVDSNYNYWAAHKRLAVVHEIYAGHSSKAYNKLKSIVTDKHISVSKKYQANYMIENWIHILACSNSMRAIQLSMDDRRWFVPKLTEEKKPISYWTDLNRWLVEEGGLEAIRYYCIEWVKTNNPVMKGESAPWSAAKREIVEEGYSPGMEAVGSLLDMLKDRLTSEDPAALAFRERLFKARMYREGSAFLCDKDLVEYIKIKLHDGRSTDRIEKPSTLRKVAKARGWHIGEDKAQHFRWGLNRRGARVVSLLARDATTKPADLDLLPIDLSMVEGL